MSPRGRIPGTGASGPGAHPVSRRALLGAAAAGATGLVLGRGGLRSAPGGTGRRPGIDTRLAAATLRQPGSLPNPAVRPGTESLPEIEHIVVVMMENHSFDNLLGLTGRGDGFPLGADGLAQGRLPRRQGRAASTPIPCRANA